MMLAVKPEDRASAHALLHHSYIISTTASGMGRSVK